MSAKKPLSRPSTPHRLSSHDQSIFGPSPGGHYPIDPAHLPLDNHVSLFRELNDSLGDLDLNFQNLQQVHESLSNFNESFSSFIYGLKMNAWCTEFGEAPTSENFQRQEIMGSMQNSLSGNNNNLNNNILNQQQFNPTNNINNDPSPVKLQSRDRNLNRGGLSLKHESSINPDDTYMTNDASFVVQPQPRQPQSSNIRVPSSRIPRVNAPQQGNTGNTSGRSRIPQSRIPGSRSIEGTSTRTARSNSIKNRPPFR